MTEKVFVAGMIFKPPHDRAPDFVKGTLSIKVGEFEAFCRQHAKDGWVNIDLKVAQSGKYYAELNTFKKTEGEHGKQGMAQAKAAAAPQPPQYDEFEDKDLPF